MEWRCPGRLVTRAGLAGAACSRSTEARRECALKLALSACPLAETCSALTRSKGRDGSNSYLQTMILAQNVKRMSQL